MVRAWFTIRFAFVPRFRVVKLTLPATLLILTPRLLAPPAVVPAFTVAILTDPPVVPLIEMATWLAVL